MQQAALSRREIQVVWGCCSYCCSVVCLRKSARDIWGFFWVYWLSPLPCYSPADSADHAEECSKLHYFAEKDRLVRLRLFCCFGFCLRKSARSAGDIGVSSVYIDWVSLDVYSPADSADHAEECSRLHYHAEKDRLVRLMLLLLFCCFGFCLRKSARSAGDFWGFIWAI
jgi:hypothetical protein